MTNQERIAVALLAGENVSTLDGGAYAVKRALRAMGHKVITVAPRTIRMPEPPSDVTPQQVIDEINRHARKLRAERLPPKQKPRPAPAPPPAHVASTLEELREKREAEKAQLERHTFESFRQPAMMLGMSTGSVSVPPQLGDHIQVFAMILQDDGSLRMGLQDGSRRWIVDVVGEMEREGA